MTAAALHILAALDETPRSAREIARRSGYAPSRVWAHLSAMHRLGMVGRRNPSPDRPALSWVRRVQHAQENP